MVGDTRKESKYDGGVVSAFVMMLAVIDKEISQVDFPLIILVFSKTYGMHQILISKVCVKKCIVYAAQIYEIQASARHDKQRFRVTLGTFRKILGKIGDMPDTTMQVELANAD